MLEYGVYNLHTDAEMIIYGYSFADACKRAKLNPGDYQIIYMDYID